MAQYKVPQDVEADDKLLGPFSFRQFVYLLIAGGCIAVAVGLFQLFPLLCIIPILPALFLAAIVSYYLKPHKRIWTPGQRESTIKITAPKIVEESRTRDITGEEATHRLSFLADIVDTGGYAIKGAGSNSMREDLIAEANATNDIFETSHFDSLEHTIARDENQRHDNVIREMRAAIDKSESMNINNDTKPMIRSGFDDARVEQATQPIVDTFEKSDDDMMKSPVVIMPEPVSKTRAVENSDKDEQNLVRKNEQTQPKPSIIELANNSEFSVATIAKEANRIKERDDGEVYISLH